MKKKVFVTLMAAIVLTIGCHIANTVKQNLKASTSICLYPDPPEDPPTPPEEPEPPNGGK